MGSGEASGDLARVPRLVADCDPGSLTLTPAEGFLLSRIDGQTPWSVLQQIGGLAPGEVDARLEDWLAAGVIECETPLGREARQSTCSAGAQKAAAAATPIDGVDRSELDESLDLEIAVQERILAFEAGLGQPYHALLGVDRDSDAKEIKRAYFGLSKEFHPDRYFRREIGAYAKKLEVIFKRVLEAYELLSDPNARAEVERSLDAAGPCAAAAAGDASAAHPMPPPPTNRPMTKLERLRARMPFRIPEAVLAERRQRAKEFFDAARMSEQRGRYVEAASTIRLAIAFDPFNEDYRRGFGDVQARAAEMRAQQLLDEAREVEGPELQNPKHQKEALRLYEEALLYRPHDPELCDKAAHLALDNEQVEKALDYATRAVEHSPEVGAHRRTLARVYMAQSDNGHAVRELEKAIELDPKDREASELMTRARQGGRSLARRGNG